MTVYISALLDRLEETLSNECECIALPCLMLHNLCLYPEKETRNALTTHDQFTN